MKILITGSNGLLGQKLIYALLNRTDISIIACARGENRITRKNGYHFESCDLSDQSTVTAIIKKHRLPKEPSSDDTDYWVAISLTVLFQDERFRQFQVQSPDAVVGGGSIWLFQIQRAP